MGCITVWYSSCTACDHKALRGVADLCGHSFQETVIRAAAGSEEAGAGRFEIILWRKGDIVRKSMSHQAAIASQRFEGSASAERALAQAKEDND
ncbi:hypothetical protein SRHO_G00222480 [Serrasalmus rhombeus]